MAMLSPGFIVWVSLPIIPQPEQKAIRKVYTIQYYDLHNIVKISNGCLELEIVGKGMIQDEQKTELTCQYMENKLIENVLSCKDELKKQEISIPDLKCWKKQICSSKEMEADFVFSTSIDWE